MSDDTSETIAVILARMETKLDLAIDQGKDHETRIRLLEQMKWKLAGGAAAIGGGAALLTKALGH